MKITTNKELEEYLDREELELSLMRKATQDVIRQSRDTTPPPGNKPINTPPQAVNKYIAQQEKLQEVLRAKDSITAEQVKEQVKRAQEIQERIRIQVEDNYKLTEEIIKKTEEAIKQHNYKKALSVAWNKHTSTG